MHHFDISQWADLARGVVPVADRAAMEMHVSSNCVRCRTTLDLMRRIVAAARATDQDTLSENVVRCAKAISALQRPRQVQPFRLLARLVYDSFRDPLPAGMRADDRASHHALYEAGNFCLDVRIEQEKGSPVVSLVGQVANREAPDSDMPTAPVLLMSRKAIVAHAVYNRFGEFRLEYAPAPQLRLRVSVDSAKGIEVPLSRFVIPRSPGREATAAFNRLGQKPAGRGRH